jgi:hypothetical protein
MDQKDSNIVPLPKFGDLLKRSFSLYKSKFWTLIGVTLLSFLSGYVAFGLWWLLSIFISLPAIEEVIEGTVSGALYLLLSLLLYLFAIFLSLFCQLALLYIISQGAGIKEAFKKAWFRIIPYWWLTIISGVLIFGGFLLFFIPGILLTIWFILSSYIFVAEDRKGMSALLRSKQLVSGREWTVLGRTTLIVLGFMVLSFITSKFFFGESLFSLIFTPFFQVFWFLFYQDLKKAKGEPVFEEPRKSDKFKAALPAILGYCILAVAIVLVLLKTI